MNSTSLLSNPGLRWVFPSAAHVNGQQLAVVRNIAKRGVFLNANIIYIDINLHRTHENCSFCVAMLKSATVKHPMVY